MAKLQLPTVTLCAATSVNLEATMAALRACLDKIDFADCVLLTDARITIDDPGIRVVPIERLHSSRDYSEFMLKRLVGHIRSTHCLVVQWDGFVLDERCWDPSFLDVDYIGAPWPQFDDGYDVGNGGFSLRSLKLLEACRELAFTTSHPEDVAICRVHRPMLERQYGIRFADEKTASRFAYERAIPLGRTFGFHGIFNMISAVGPERFWDLYSSLDDPTTAFADYRALMGQLGKGRDMVRRRWRLTMDWLGHLVAR